MTSRYSGLSLSNRAIPGQAQVLSYHEKRVAGNAQWLMVAEDKECVFSQCQWLVTISFCNQGNQGLLRRLFQDLGQFHSKDAGWQASCVDGSGPGCLILIFLLSPSPLPYLPLWRHRTWVTLLALYTYSCSILPNVAALVSAFGFVVRGYF